MPQKLHNDKEQNQSLAAANSNHFKQEGIASATPLPLDLSSEPVELKKDDEEKNKALQKKAANTSFADDGAPSQPNGDGNNNGSNNSNNNSNQSFLKTLQQRSTGQQLAQKKETPQEKAPKENILTTLQRKYKEENKATKQAKNKQSFADDGSPTPPPSTPSGGSNNRNENILTTLQRKHNAYHAPVTPVVPFQLKYNKSDIPKPKQFKKFDPFQLKQAPKTKPADSKKGKGQGQLPQEVQGKMENSLGQDFSDVNVHKDSKEATDAGALAYAQGNDVHFAPGQFQPETQKGQELIGHELTHVKQQREGRVKPTKMLGKGMAINDDPALEKEADVLGAKAAKGEATSQQKKSNKTTEEQPVQGKFTETPKQLSAAAPPPTSPASTPKTKAPSTGIPAPGNDINITLFGHPLSIDLSNVPNSATINLNLPLAAGVKATKIELTLEEGNLVTGRLFLESTALLGVDLILEINSAGEVAVDVSIETTIFDLPTTAAAQITEEGLVGSILITIPENYAISEALTAAEGSISYDFSSEVNLFTGFLTVNTNDGFASGSAAVAYELGNSYVTGTATITSLEDKTLNLAQGATIVLPAGMEITASFGEEGTQLQGSATAELNVAINTDNGLGLENISVLNIEVGLDNNGLHLVALALDSTTTIAGMEAKVNGSMTEGVFAGTVSIELTEPKSIADTITAESGIMSYTFGEEGGFVGDLAVKTNDGFLTGNAAVNYDATTSAWSGVASVASQTPKFFQLADGIVLSLPAGMSLSVDFGAEGTQITGDAAIQIDVDISTESGLAMTNLSTANLELGIDNSGIKIVSVSIDSTTTIWGLEAKVLATAGPDSMMGSVNIDLTEPKTIGNFLTITAGSLSFNFGTPTAFEGEVTVVTTDGFAEGTATVNLDPANGEWSGNAMLSSLAAKTIEIIPGVVAELPAGIELSIVFGSGEFDVDGRANVLVDINLTTGSGLDVEGEAAMEIALSNTGISVISLELSATAMVLEQEATVNLSIINGQLTGSGHLELEAGLNLTDYLIATNGSFDFDIGTTGLISGEIAVETVDGFATGTAVIDIDMVNHEWSGTATVSTAMPKDLDVATGVALTIPEGGEMVVQFGSEGVSVQAEASLNAEVDLSSESGVQAKGLAEFDITLSSEGVSIAPTTITLGVTGGLSTPDIDAIVNDGHLTTEVDNGAILRLIFTEEGLSRVDLEATGAFSNEEKRIGRISFAGQVKLNPVSFNGVLNAVSQAELDIVTGEKYGIVMVAGSQFFVYLDDQGIANIDASLAAELKQNEEAIARLKLIGMLPRGEGLSLAATIELLKDLQLIEPDEDNLGVSLLSGASLGATFEGGSLTKIEGTVGLGVTDNEGSLLGGELTGVVAMDSEQNFSIESGSGSLSLLKDYPIDVGNGSVTIKTGASLSATFGDGTLQGIGGNVEAFYYDGTTTITIMADLDYDIPNKSIRSLDAALSVETPIELFDGNLILSGLSGSISIRDNQIVQIGGDVNLEAHIGDFDLYGEASVTWLNSEEGNKFIGNGWLEFNWSETEENPDRFFIGRVDASINGDLFEVTGQVEMGLMKGLTGAASIWIDQELDPIISASLTYSATLMEADELWAFEQEFGISMMVFPGISIGAGIMFGIGIFTRPLMVTGTAGVENWRPSSNAFPDFTARLQASWGVDVKAKALAYLELVLGIDNVLYFAAGIRAGVELNLPIEIMPWIELHGGEDGIWGEMGLDLAINPILELIVEAYMEWGVLGIWEGDKVWELVAQQLGDMGSLNWSGSFAFGDKEEPSGEISAPPQTVNPTGTPTLEDGGSQPQDLGIGNHESEPEGEGGLSGLTDGINSPTKDGEEEPDTEGMGSELEKVAKYAQGIGAVGKLLGIIMDGFKSFMKGGPVGLIIWMIFNKPPKSEIDALKAQIEAFRQELAGEKYIETGSTIDKVLGVLSGEYSLWVVIDNNLPFKKLIEKGEHERATNDERAIIADELLDGPTMDGAEQAMLTMINYVFHNEGQGSVREIVEKSGGRDRWDDNFHNDIWGRDEQDELDWYLDQAYGSHNNDDASGMTTYTPEPGAYIERNNRSWEEMAKLAFGDESYALYLIAYDKNPNPNVLNVHIPYDNEIKEIALTTIGQRFQLPTTIEYAHAHETFDFIATNVYGDSQLSAKLATINTLATEADVQEMIITSIFPFQFDLVMVTKMDEGATLILPTADELGPPWIEVAPVPIGSTGYNVWVSPGATLQDVPIMYAGAPDQPVTEIADQARQTTEGQDVGEQLALAATFEAGAVSQLIAENAVTRAAGLIDFLLISDLFAFEADNDNSNNDIDLNTVQPGDIIPIGNHDLKTVAEEVYNHPERTAWIKANQPTGPSNEPPVAEEANLEAVNKEAAPDSKIDISITVSENIKVQADKKQAHTSAKTNQTDQGNTSQGESGPLPPGMIDLPTWPEMEAMDSLPVAERGVAPKSTIEATSSDTWASLAIVAYDNWEKALALSDHSGNDNVTLAAGAQIFLPAANQLNQTTVTAVAQDDVAKTVAPGGDNGPVSDGDGPISTTAETTKVPAETDGSSEGPRVVAPGTKIKAIEGDTWSGLAKEAYDDFTLFPRLVNHPANANVKTLAVGEWITIPTLEDLMNTEEFGLGLSPGGFPLLTEMVRIPTEDGLHHVWVEDRSNGTDTSPGANETENRSNGDGTWMMASDPFELEPEAQQVVQDTINNPEINQHAQEVLDMTHGEQTTASIDSTRTDIIALTEANLLAAEEEQATDLSDFCIDGVPEEFVTHLILREGFETEVYLDTESLPTVGLGHLLTAAEQETYSVGDTVPMSQLVEWAETNVLHAYSGGETQAATLGITDSAFILALGSVCYQLGNGWYDIHKKTWGFMELKQWEKAAVEVEDSQWHSQTPTRTADFQAALRALAPATEDENGTTIPRADLASNANSLAHNRWIDDGMLSTYGDEFLEIIDRHIKEIFGDDETRESIIDQICTLEADECTDEAEEMRAKLFRANQYAVIEVLDVENDSKYQPGKGKTYCNVYAYDVVTALGGYLPRVWWNDDALTRIENGETVTAIYGTTVHEMNANALNTWMREYGDDFGWVQEDDMENAQEEANSGKIAIILASNKVASRSGHVAVILSETDQLTANGDKPLISQAGGTNVEAAAASSKWWENSNHKLGAAWIYEGVLDSPIMTPEQIGGNMANEGPVNTNTNTDNGNDTGNNNDGYSISGSVGQGGDNIQADVETVQTLLDCAGHSPGAIDGMIGPNTIQAIKNFQAAHFNFTPDGLVEVGGNTWKKLVELSEGSTHDFEVGVSTPDGTVINQRGIVAFSNDAIKLKVRSAPDANDSSNILEELDFGAIVQIVSEPNTPPGWYKVVTSCDTVGYSAKDYYWMSLPEENPTLYKVKAGETLLGIIDRELPNYGIDRRTLVNIIAHMNNSIDVTDSVSGWESASVNVNDIIYLPSQTYADSMKDQVNSGSITQEALDQLAEFGNLGGLLNITALPDDPSEILTFFLNNINSLLQYAPGIGQLLTVLQKLEKIREFFELAEAAVDEITDQIKQKIEEAIAEVEDKAREALTANGVPESHIDGVMNHLTPMFEELKENWWKMVKDALWDLVWPIPGVWKDVKSLFSNLLVAGNHLWNFEFSKFVDSVLDIWGNINAAIGRLEGWISITMIAAPTIAGAMAGGVGAIPGFMAGVATANSFGLTLLASAGAEQIAKLIKGITSLYSIEEAGEDEEKALHNEIYYEEIAGSSLAIGVLGSMITVAAIGAQIGRAIYKGVKAKYKKPSDGIAGSSMAGKVVRGVSFEDFVASAKDLGNNIKHAEDAFTHFENQNWAALEDLFNTNNYNNWGGTVYPPNEGFINITTETIPSGFKMDRYGHEGGTFVSEQGASFDSRALPDASLSGPYHQYDVIQPIPSVKAGPAIPWFGKSGGGTQYKLPEKVGDLMPAYLKRTTGGAQIAKNNGWPDAPAGYHWKASGDSAVISKNPGSTNAKLKFDEATGKFIAKDRPDLTFDPDSTLFTDASGNSFKYDSGTFVAVSGASGFAVGNTMASRTVANTRIGNDKVILIGTDMSTLNDVAAHLGGNGHFIEILDDAFLNGRTWAIDGKDWTVDSAWNDMVNNPDWDIYRGPKGRILDAHLPKTPMYKLNKAWIEESAASGSTILDMGNPSGKSSIFYDMEVNSVIWD